MGGREGGRGAYVTTTSLAYCWRGKVVGCLLCVSGVFAKATLPQRQFGYVHDFHINLTVITNTHCCITFLVSFVALLVPAGSVRKDP